MTGSAVAIAGRTAESELVSAVLAGHSDSAALLVAGEAGVGKSRLVAAAADVAASAGVLTAAGWCLSLSEGIPLLPLTDVVRALGKSNGGQLIAAALAECPPFVATEVSRLVPEVGSATEPSIPGTPDDGWRKQRLFDGLAELLDAMVKLRRIGVVVEDVHWADTTTLEFLEFLLSPARESSAPVVLTWRTDETPQPALRAWLERLHRNPRVRRLDLAPLTVAETGEQIALLLNRAPSPNFVKAIAARSEGNAFFTEQLVSAAGLGERSAELPPGLRSLLLWRVDQVIGVARQVVAALAVARRPLNEHSVGLLCDQPQAAVRAALRDLLAGRLLRRPDVAGRYQLRHALLAAAVDAELLAGERRELHARVADMMAGWDDATVAAEIAEHLDAAGRHRDELRWRLVAARYADSVFASAEAAEQWQRMIALSADAPGGAIVEGMTLAELYGAAEDALALSGDDEAASRLAEQALQRLTAADPVSRADVLRRAGNARGIDAPEAGLELLYQALAIYDTLPPAAGQVKTIKELAGILHNDGRPDDARGLIDRGAELAERAGLDYPLFEFRCVQAMYEARTGAPGTALRQIEKLRESLTEADGASPYLWLAIFHGSILIDLGRLSDVEEALAPALQLAAAHGMDSSFKATQVRANLVETLLQLGATDAAAGWVEPRTQATAGLSTWFDYANRAVVEMLRGNLDEAQQRWAEIEHLPASTLAFEAGWVVWKAELELWRDAAQNAFELADTLLARLAAAGQSDCDGLLLVLGQRACADLAEHGRSRREATAVEAAMASADRVSQLRERIAPDPFVPGPFRPTPPPITHPGTLNLAACTVNRIRRCGRPQRPRGTT